MKIRLKARKKSFKKPILRNHNRNSSNISYQNSIYSNNLTLEEKSKNNWDKDFKRSEVIKNLIQKLIVQDIEEYLIAQDKFTRSQNKMNKANEEHDKELERVKQKAESYNQKANEVLLKNKETEKRLAIRALEYSKNFLKKNEKL